MNETPNYIPIIISSIAALISGLSLGWNIYRDVIRKPKLKLQLGVNFVIDNDGTKQDGPFISLLATNHGPGPIICSNVFIIKRKFIFRKRHYMVTPDFRHPHCGKLPFKIEVGESLRLIYKYHNKCFIRSLPNSMLMIDSFGKYHFVPKKDLRIVIKHYIDEFGKSFIKEDI